MFSLSFPELFSLLALRVFITLLILAGTVFALRTGLSLGECRLLKRMFITRLFDPWNPRIALSSDRRANFARPVHLALAGSTWFQQIAATFGGPTFPLLQPPPSHRLVVST